VCPGRRPAEESLDDEKRFGNERTDDADGRTFGVVGPATGEDPGAVG